MYFTRLREAAPIRIGIGFSIFTGALFLFGPLKFRFQDVLWLILMVAIYAVFIVIRQPIVGFKPARIDLVSTSDAKLTVAHSRGPRASHGPSRGRRVAYFVMAAIALAVFVFSFANTMSRRIGSFGNTMSRRIGENYESALAEGLAGAEITHGIYFRNPRGRLRSS